MARRETGGAAPAFGALLKTFRTQAGVSQEQLAERAGVSASAVGALEQGIRRAPYRETIERLSSALALNDRDRRQMHDAADAARGRTQRAVFVSPRLPMPGTSFVERSEVAEIAALLERRRFVTITGAGGIGKTRTALEAARQVGARGIACTFVDFTAAVDEDGLWAAIAAARDVRSAEHTSLSEAVCKSAAAVPLLLVLDNCEHVVEHAARVARTLVDAAPTLRLLITSRERLGLTTELVYRLPSMTAETALRLFMERAEASDAHAHEAFGNVDLLHEICRILEGIPLALELAAFHLGSLGADALLARLRAGFSLLGPRDLPQRHQTMSAAIAWSFDLLQPAERVVLERLSVFAGGFTAQAAMDVCADEHASSAQVAAIVQQLVQKSLVRVERSAAEPRYSLLETVRLYASGQLDARGAAPDGRRRHLRWLVSVARAFSASRPRPSAAGLRVEMENIRAALRWAVDSDDEDDVVAAATIAGRLRLVWFALDRSGELQTSVERLLERLRDPEHADVMAYLYVALVNCEEWNPDTLLTRGERAVDLLLRTGDAAVAASVSAQIAVRVALLGRRRRAEELLAACAEWIDGPDAEGTPEHLTVLHNRASARRQMELFDPARADLRRILATRDAAVDSDSHFEIHALIMLAAVEFESGDAHAAKQLGEHIVERFAPPTDESPHWLAVVHVDLGRYNLALDRLHDAKRHLLVAIGILRELGSMWQAPYLYLAGVFARLGTYAPAARLLGFVDSHDARPGARLGSGLSRLDAGVRAMVVDALDAFDRGECAAERERGARQNYAEIAAIVEA